MAKDLFRKYVWLVDTISEHKDKRISLAEIQSKWRNSSLNDEGTELSARTFLNHRRQIGLQFGIYIEYDKSSNT